MTRGNLIGVVDAGFLRKSLALALRTEVAPFDLDPIDVVTWFAYSAQRAGLIFHRLYWYDAQYETKHNEYQRQRVQFSELAQTPGLRLRLGTLVSRSTAWHSPLKRALDASGIDREKFKEHFDFRANYEQKGVDTLIVLDLLRLAQSAAYDTVILMAGDSDFAEAVRAVQDLGRRVIIAYPTGAGVSPQLCELADETVRLEEVQLRRMLRSKAGLESFALPESDAESDTTSSSG